MKIMLLVEVGVHRREGRNQDGIKTALETRKEENNSLFLIIWELPTYSASEAPSGLTIHV